jgi:hypothetical protein
MRSFINPVNSEVVEMTDAQFAEYHDETLAKWEASKTALDAAKEGEMSLRKLYVALASDPTKQKGTENIALNNGYRAKVVKKINYGFVKGADAKVDWEAVMSAQDEIEKTGNQGAFIAERLFKWEATLSVSEYSKLDVSNPSEAKIKAIADRVIVTTDGAPTLEIIAPKG